ncbi:MAG: response regulator [Candidatus Bathyarchaeota archaeon]|nr:response regulator [Candidatus Bathyarchaeota archaeon]
MGDQKRILIVDDDETIRETLSLLLEEEGYIVDKAETGQSAIAKSNSNFYNLAIIDWRLPDIEGTKLLASLKETVPPMVKIMLTGFPSMQNAIDSVNEGADAFVLKPVEGEVLLNKVKELLKQQDESRKFSEQKVASFIETRGKELLQSKKSARFK